MANFVSETFAYTALQEASHAEVAPSRVEVFYASISRSLESLRSWPSPVKRRRVSKSKIKKSSTAVNPQSWQEPPGR